MNHTLNNSRTFPRLGGGHAQRGVALVIALILLVVITLVGLASIGTTILQNKAASNQLDRQLAFQSTEAALRAAEVAVSQAAANNAAPNAGFKDCSLGSGNSCPANPFTETGATIVNVGTGTFNAGALAADQPQYIVQYLGRFKVPAPDVFQLSNSTGYNSPKTSPKADFYRITARSGDPSTLGGRSIVLLQSTFRY